MDIISAIFIIIFCIIGSALFYGIWVLENDRYEFRKKHGIDPKYHGWIVKDSDNDSTDKDQ